MESYKQEKIIIIMYEYLNDKREFYPISNVPLDKAKFFYKDDNGLFKLMAVSDYTVKTELNENRLYIVNAAIKDNSEKFQIGYEINFKAAEYESPLPVLSVLTKMYNQLIEDTRILHSYIRKQCFVADGKEQALVLPGLPTHTVWCMGENGKMFALPVSELYGKFQQLIDTLHKEIKKLLDIDLKVLSDELKKQLAEHVLALTNELNKHKIELNDYTQEKIKEIQATCERLIDLAFNKLTKADTILELQSRKNLKVGDIVEVLGYYEAGDGAGHKRIIANEDDGSGVQLNNGLWANIIHNGEIYSNWYGVKTNSNITSFLNKVLSDEKIRKVIINKGYYILEQVRVMSNKTLIGEDSVVMDCEWSDFIFGTYEFGDSENITIKNIKFIHERSTVGGVSITFLNGDNILLEDLIFDKVCTEYGHVIDMCGGKNITIRRCQFLGKYESEKPTSTVYKEYIQFDGSFNPAAFGSAYDKTTNLTGRANENVVIENCLFSHNGSSDWQGVYIGVHSAFTKPHKNIIIRDNEFYLKNYQSAIRLAGFENIAITNNTFEDEGTDLERVDNGRAIILGTIIKENLPGGTWSDTYSSIKNLTISNNVFRVKGTHLGSSGVMEFQYHNIAKTQKKYTNFKIINNTIEANNGENVIELNFIHVDGIFVNKNTIVTNRRRALHFLSCDNIVVSNNFYTIKNNGGILAGIGGTTGDVRATNAIINNNISVFSKDKVESDVESENYSIMVYGYKKANITNNISDGGISFNDTYEGIVSHNNVKFISNNSSCKIFKDNIVNGSVQLNEVINKLNTSFMTTKMQQEGVYSDFISYMDEKTLYDKQQRKLEQDRQLAYEESFKENPNLTYEEFLSTQPMTLNLITIEEPQPSEALKKFMEKYL